MADDAGELLVRSGLVSSAALDEARAKVADQGGTIGEHLVGASTVDDDKLTAFYKQRLLVPQVNPNTLARLPAKVVAVIPSEMAIELRAIPVSLDSDNNLTVAMSDPSDRHAVDEISFITGAYVVRAVATQMQIAWCLAHYYGHVTELGERLLQPEEGEPAPRAKSDSQAGARKRGVTGEVAASRHKAIVPGEAFVDAKPEPAAPEPVPENRRSKTASGEIRVPRAPSIKPPLPDDSGPVIVEDAVPVESGQVSVESGPVMVMEVDSGPVAAPGRESDQAIEILAPEGSPYEPMMEIEDGKSKPVPRRRRPAEPDPPELAARAGEVQLATGQSIKQIVFDEPAIIVSDELNEDLDARRSIQVSGEVAGREHRDRGPTDDELSSIFVELGDEDSAPVMIHDTRTDESGPVLLERAKDPTVTVTLTGVPKAEIHDESEPIVLPPKRPAAAAVKRKPAKTQVGIGAVTAATRRALGVATPESGVPTAEMDDIPTDARPALDADPTRIELHAVPPRDDDSSDDHVAAPPSPYPDRDTSPFIVPPPTSNPTPGASGKIRLDGVKRAEYEADEEDTVTGSPTSVMSAIELDDVIPNRTSGILPAHLEKGRAQPPPVADDDLDDGWGPPGTTIPPPLLGAIPGAITPASGIIPMPDMDSAPLIVAPPLPPERGVRAQTATEAGLQRALEDATLRVLELIHTLDHATDRDQIIAVMIAHLAESHRRAGFFAMRAGALSLFAITPRVPEMSEAQLRLDRPSTLGDVVGTRLPYRGPMLDETSRAFLAATLGSSPPEILLVPIAVRERVVGVLFGDQRAKHTFDDQLALAARAAGMALERLLKTKRG